jgi:hypothetical protein
MVRARPDAPLLQHDELFFFPMTLPDLPLLYHLPLWLIPLLFLVLLAGSSEFGFRFGLRRRHA